MIKNSAQGMKGLWGYGSHAFGKIASALFFAHFFQLTFFLGLGIINYKNWNTKCLEVLVYEKR